MKKFPFILSLGGGFLIVLISIYGFFLLLHRPGLPPEINIKNITRADFIEIEQAKDLDFILIKKTIGEPIILHLKYDGKTEKKEARLMPYYSNAPFPLIYLFIGLFIMGIGVFVFFLKSEDTEARLFYWTTLVSASCIIISGGFWCLRNFWISYIPGSLFYILYPLAPALLMHFSLSFSKGNLGRWKYFFIYSPALLLSGILETTFLLSSLKSSITIYRIYHSIYYFFRFYLVIYLFLTIFFLILYYRKIILEEKRAQIKWIFYGLTIGLGPFIFLYQLPQVLRLTPLLSEEISQVFFIIIPIAIAFSIIKFKLMNIELVINRSLVYTILTIFTVSIYLFSVTLIHNLISKFLRIREAGVFVMAALIAAVAFHPARKKIQDVVDKTFYRQRYDYSKCIQSFNERAHRIARIDHLVDFFTLKIQKTLPTEYLGVHIYSLESGQAKLIIEKDGKTDLGSLVSYSLTVKKILARKKAVKTEETIDFSQEDLLEKQKLDMLIPLIFRSTDLAGFICFGKKKSGERFKRNDLELLNTMAGELAVNLERISLQEEVIYERAEKEKLDELSRLKTEFISTVSHELRTPMSSIQGITEILHEGKIKDKTKTDELLDIMSGEISRLSRFLHNILDFGKIEQNVKTYNFQNTEIRTVIEDVVKLFQYRLQSGGFVLRTHFPKKTIFLKIDEDSVKQALTNLIDNAIKYSPENKEIDIKLREQGKQIRIQVQDKGIGIAPAKQKKIFDGFYRVGGERQKSIKGVGLGLKIVRHIMSAHKGKIEVQSRPGKGSTFSLIFPIT
ncbi:MAG: HAMP domain-containing histidine kinase [Candidatus Aminicenantes bacterium]|nr:HAMP domain-containing histidine kinase [Candidatus Aminicenantes bacterium]